MVLFPSFEVQYLWRKKKKVKALKIERKKKEMKSEKERKGDKFLMEPGWSVSQHGHFKSFALFCTKQDGHSQSFPEVSFGSFFVSFGLSIGSEVELFWVSTKKIVKCFINFLKKKKKKKKKKNLLSPKLNPPEDGSVFVVPKVNPPEVGISFLSFPKLNPPEVFGVSVVVPKLSAVKVVSGFISVFTSVFPKLNPPEAGSFFSVPKLNPPGADSFFVSVVVPKLRPVEGGFVSVFVSVFGAPKLKVEVVLLSWPKPLKLKPEEVICPPDNGAAPFFWGSTPFSKRKFN